MRRIGSISFAALVALGLLWSAAATSKVVPIAQRGNQLGLDAVRLALAGPPALRQQWHCA